MKQCLFDENAADYGGAIFRGSTDGNIIGNVFEANKATRIGGAIYDSHAKVCLARGNCPCCTFITITFLGEQRQNLFVAHLACTASVDMPPFASLLEHQPLILQRWGALQLFVSMKDSHCIVLQGDILGNTFFGNNAPQAAAIYRTVSSGDVHDNKRLEDSQVELDNPASN